MSYCTLLINCAPFSTVLAPGKFGINPIDRLYKYPISLNMYLATLSGEK